MTKDQRIAQYLQACSDLEAMIALGPNKYNFETFADDYNRLRMEIETMERTLDGYYSQDIAYSVD